MFSTGTKRTVHISWSSRSMFVLAGIGAAIGFRTFWQFPSLMFEYGGGAFLIVYFLFLLLLGLPLLAAEYVIGRLGRTAPDGAFRRAAMQMRSGHPWWIIGATAVLGGFLIFSYLSVIAGWTVAFGLRAVNGVFAGLTADGISSIFMLLVKDPEKQLFWYTLFIVSIVAVCARGLRDGPEPAIRYVVPTVLGLMALLLIYVAGTGGFAHALTATFMPDFSKMSWTGTLAAARYAFFSLSLGGGAMFMFGAYLERDAPLGRLTWYVILLNALAGVVATLIVDTLLSVGGVEPVTDMNMLFQALPLAFDRLPLGQLWLAMFFIMLIAASWVSGLVLFEPVVMWAVERLQWPRLRAAVVCGIAAWVLALVAALSFNVWSFPFKFFDQVKKFGLFDVIEIFSSHALLPIVGIGTSLFAGWVLKTELAREQLHVRSPCLFDAWLWLVRLVIPVTLLLVTFNAAKL